MQKSFDTKWLLQTAYVHVPDYLCRQVWMRMRHTPLTATIYPVTAFSQVLPAAARKLQEKVPRRQQQAGILPVLGV